MPVSFQKICQFFGAKYQPQRNRNFECDPNNDGTFPNPTDCRQYYHCINSVSWPQQCPSDYAFSPSFNIRDCVMEVCVERERARCPVNGGWSEWSEFSVCYPDCGNGLKARFRKCNNPPPSNGGLPCSGNNVEVEECSLGDCVSKLPAFFVSNRSRTQTEPNKHTFDKVYINNDNVYNATSSSVTVKERGYYWFTLIVTNKSYKGRENNVTISAEFDKSVEKSITYERSAIMLMEPGFKLYRFTYGTKTVEGSELGAETSWLGYKLNSSNLYYAQRSGRISGPSTLEFNHVRISNGISGSSTLTVSKSGYYYIGFTFKHTSLSHVVLRKNQIPIDEMWMNITYALIVRHDLPSKAIILKLNSGDSFDMFLQEGRLSSFTGRHISLSAYHLTDTSELATVVRNTDFSESSFKKLEFDYELYNVGNSWDSNNHHFKCKNFGLYKVSIYIGITRGVQTIGEILVNGAVQTRLYSLLIESSKSRAMSRTVLLNLKANDIISLKVQGGLDKTITNTVMNIFHIAN